MPERLLLDGFDLDDVIARVRNDLGPDAKIVKVEKITRGTIFRKVEYEVTVDLPDKPRPSPRALGRARVAASEAGQVDLTPTDVEPGTPDDSDEPNAPATAAPSIPEDVDTVIGVLRTMTGPVPVSTGAPTRYGNAPAPTFTPKPATPTPAPIPASARPAAKTTTAPPPFPVPAPQPAPEPTSVRAATAAAPVPVDTPLTPDQELIDALAKLGVPTARLHPARPGRPVTISTVMDAPAHPPALPDKTDSVVLVIGAGQNPAMIAQALADRLGTPTPTSIATGANPHDVIDTIQWRALHNGPLTLTCAIGIDISDAMRAAPVIAAVKPDQVWAVVDARVKASDTRQWLEAAAGQRRIDALAVRALAETAQPGTVLDLGIPIGYLDGAPANNTAWVAVLAERLHDDDWG